MLAPPLFLGVDASTTACKALVWDASGKLVSEGRASISLEVRDDAYEQDAESWWTATCHAVRQAIGSLSRDEIGRLASLSIASQRETFVVTDAGGTPLCPALVWMDRRCREEVLSAVAALGTDTLHRISGKPPCTTPSFYKLLYLLGRDKPQLRGRDFRVLEVHGFLSWRMTAEFVTSTAAADPTGMIDMQTGKWSEPLLEYAELQLHQLPALVTPGALIGGLVHDAAQALGLPRGLPVIAGAGDGQAAALGAGITTTRDAYLNLGTAVVCGLSSPRYLADRAFRTLYSAEPGSYIFETDLQGGTFIVNWLADTLGAAPADRAAKILELDSAAGALEPGAQGLMAVPYWNGVMNPYWDDDASGMFFGLRGAHRPEHLYRALLEGIAFEQRLHLEAVESAIGRTVSSLVLVGGGSQSKLFSRIVANVLKRPLLRLHTPEATALGAAMLAGTGAGIFASAGNAAQAMARTQLAFEPDQDCVKYDALYAEVYRGLYPAVSGLLASLARLSAS